MFIRRILHSGRAYKATMRKRFCEKYGITLGNESEKSVDPVDSGMAEWSLSKLSLYIVLCLVFVQSLVMSMHLVSLVQEVMS